MSPPSASSGVDRSRVADANDWSLLSPAQRDSSGLWLKRDVTSPLDGPVGFEGAEIDAMCVCCTTLFKFDAKLILWSLT